MPKIPFFRIFLDSSPKTRYHFCQNLKTQKIAKTVKFEIFHIFVVNFVNFLSRHMESSIAKWRVKNHFLAIFSEKEAKNRQKSLFLPFLAKNLTFEYVKTGPYSHGWMQKSKNSKTPKKSKKRQFYLKKVKKWQNLEKPIKPKKWIYGV